MKLLSQETEVWLTPRTVGQMNSHPWPLAAIAALILLFPTYGKDQRRLCNTVVLCRSTSEEVHEICQLE